MTPTSIPKSISRYDLTELLSEQDGDGAHFTIKTTEQGLLISVAHRTDNLDDTLVESAEDAVKVIADFLASPEGIRAARSGDLAKVTCLAEKHGVPFDAKLTIQMMNSIGERIAEEEYDHPWVSSSVHC